MKNVITVLALTLVTLSNAFATSSPKPDPKPAFILYSGSFLSPTATQLQIRTDGSVHLIETDRNTREEHETDIAFLDGQGTWDAMRAVDLVKPEMDFRNLTEQEKRLNQGCAMDSSISYWVADERFQNGQKIVIKNLGCGLVIGLADEQAARAMDKLATIVDNAYEAYLKQKNGQE